MMGSWRYYPITKHEIRWRPGEPVSGEGRPCPMCGHLVTTRAVSLATWSQPEDLVTTGAVSLATSLDSNLDRATLIRHPKLTKTDNIINGTNKLRNQEETYDTTYR